VSVPSPAGATVIVTTREQLEDIVRSAVRAELAARVAEEPEEWLDAAGVAAIVGCHPRTVQKLARNEGLPSHRVTAKLLRYRRSEVLRWLEERGARRGR
jgi:excisionase family DNA binding protein